MHIWAWKIKVSQLSWVFKTNYLLFIYLFILLIGCTQSTRFKDSSRIYRNQGSERVMIKVLLFKGKQLNSLENNITIKGNRVRYNGINYDISSGKLILDIKKEKPLYFKKYKYYGKMIVAIKKYVYVVNVLPIEEYLLGVVRAEISHTWQPEAIKAQAIAARSYVYRKYLKRRNSPYHIKSDISAQVFAGNIDVHPNIINGVYKTEGKILVYNDYPILTFFHASCGGMTEKAEDVWQTSEKFPYFKNIRCHYCTTHPYYSWKYEVEEKIVYKKLSKLVNDKVSSFYVKNLSGSGRVKDVMVKTKSGSKMITGNDLRLAINPIKVASTKFKIKKKNGKYYLEGNGFGHGVGLCQWGAKTMAERGYSAYHILNFYYKSVRFDYIENIERKISISSNQFVKK